MRCETAKTMRIKLRELINKGLARDEIIEAMQLEYGTAILATPPKTPFTLFFLWLYPVFGIGIGLLVIYLVAKRKNAKWYVTPDEIPNLTEEENMKIAEEVNTISKYEELLKEKYRKHQKHKA